MRRWRRRFVGPLVSLVLLIPAALAGQADADRAPFSLRVTGGIGFTIVHLPAFTYTRGVQRTPVLEREQEGGGPTFSAGLEAQRGRLVAVAHYQFIVAPLATDWSAHVAALSGGVARRRPASLLRASLGATMVHRTQVSRSLFAGACVYAGCEAAARVNPDGGRITTGGILLSLSAERTFGGFVGLGVEGSAATGPQRYAGVLLRVSLGAR